MSLVFGIGVATAAQTRQVRSDAGRGESQAGLRPWCSGLHLGLPDGRDAAQPRCDDQGGDAPVTPEQFNKTGKLFAPVNQVANAWGMLGPKFSAVQSGNSDTQYSVTWFDVVGRALCAADLPDAKGRYYTYQFIDAWTNNFHYASTRTMGSQKQAYALVAPGWKGALPSDVIRVDCADADGFHHRTLVRRVREGRRRRSTRSSSR